MEFIKQGLIFNPEGLGGWRENTVITPVPFLISKDVLRIYGGFRDKHGVSRIGYIDVAADNPKKVLKVSEHPVLDVGEKGMFDDNGVILGSIIQDEDGIRMYYVGFQLVKNVKFLAFSGLAISTDGGETFRRVQETPVLDRYKNEKFIRAIHTVLKEDGIYKIWYAQGDDWKIINDIPYPVYSIMYAESLDGIHIDNNTCRPCVQVQGNEYRIGRPTVFKEDGIYKMFYTRDTTDKQYSAGYAESLNGIEWERKDGAFTLGLSPSGWDSEMVCYPVPITLGDKKIIVYSGNGMGLTGVGYAERK